jgi:hypothetical protein
MMMKLTVNYKDTSLKNSNRSSRDQARKQWKERISQESILVVRKVVENIKLQLSGITQQLIVLTYFVNSASVFREAATSGEHS